MFWTAWWAWMAAGLALAVLEMLVPGFILLGFAIGAGLVGLGLLSGILGGVVALTGGYALAILAVIFAVLSLGAWFALRAAFGPPASGARNFDGDVND